MNLERWVLDATMGVPFCFCPIEGDLNGEYSIITGLNFIGDKPPNGRVVAVVHEGGQEAVDKFCADNKAAIDALFANGNSITQGD